VQAQGIRQQSLPRDRAQREQQFQSLNEGRDRSASARLT
jgi:hypothetical protein